MYMTFLAASPCAKTVAFFSNLATFLPSPAESRNSFTSNAGPLAFAFRAECGEALTERRRTAEEAMRQNTSDPILPTVQYCTVTALGCFCDAAFNGDKGPRTLGAKYAEF